MARGLEGERRAAAADDDLAGRARREREPETITVRINRSGLFIPRKIE